MHNYLDLAEPQSLWDIQLYYFHNEFFCCIFCSTPFRRNCSTRLFLHLQAKLFCHKKARNFCDQFLLKCVWYILIFHSLYQTREDLIPRDEKVCSPIKYNLSKNMSHENVFCWKQIHQYILFSISKVKVWICCQKTNYF